MRQARPGSGLLVRGRHRGMQGEIITVGNELLSGKTLDRNAGYAAERLASAGLQVTRITTVGDETETLSGVLREALARSRYVFVTGGLGSTDDDLTSGIVSKALDRPLSLDKALLERIRAGAEKRGMSMSASLEKMAWLPEGSRPLDPRGKACGFSLAVEGVRFYFLPGVHDQMRYLLDRYVLPEVLAQNSPLPVLGQSVFKLYGIGEPDIAETLKGWAKRDDRLVLGFYPRFPENEIVVNLQGEDEDAVATELERVEGRIRSLLGAYIFARGEESMAEVLGRMLRLRGLSLAVAESCTGGLIGSLLTDVPGSSGYFMGGVVVYSNQAKEDLIGVRGRTIAEYGAVSDHTAREMAEGVRGRFGTDLGLAVTGIAGPDGGSVEKPVGTVYLGLAAEGETLAGGYRFHGSRRKVKQNTAMMAMDWVRRYLRGDPFLPGL